MRIPFWKMHGAGNDFILVDDRSGAFPLADRPWIERIAARRTGVGCEGIMLIQPSAGADVRMRFINPDGSEVDMCGNGARCFARLAHELGAAPARMRIETRAGLVAAELLGPLVRLGLTEPRDWRHDASLAVAGTRVPYSFVNTGVEHVVVLVDDLARTDVVGLGRAIRYHADFQPRGTNANFAQPTGPGAIRVRTYERGVEDETLACGTGIAAAALVFAVNRRAEPPIRVTAASGAELTVDFRREHDRITAVTLLGPAEHVFTGILDYPA